MNKKFLSLFSIIVLLFIIPVFLAHYVYRHQDWLPKRTTNRGALLTPPIPFTQLNLDPTETHGKWVLLWVHPGVCDAACQNQLDVMNRLQRALGKNRNRLQRVVLTNPQDSEDPAFAATGTLQWKVDSEILAPYFKPSTVWMVSDPLGNILLSYLADQSAEDILDDLQHLMRISNIG